jgi:hypothetical protein
MTGFAVMPVFADNGFHDNPPETGFTPAMPARQFTMASFEKDSCRRSKTFCVIPALSIISDTAEGLLKAARLS